MNAKIFSVGYVPLSFPRDPISVSQYDEHVILGQIFEPLVDADGDGNLSASIAKEWHFSKDGKRIEFVVDTNIRFSNGQHVTTRDVVYSISRHLKAESQSRHFLEDIDDIKALDAHRIEVTLKKENVSILKALTRDQLGIMPNGWSFDSSSLSPFVGTGPYNLVKKSGEWILEKNVHFKRHEVSIPTWKLVFYQDSSYNVPSVLPDLAPDVTLRTLDQIKKLASFPTNQLQVSSRLSFTQTTFWLHPNGRFFKDQNKRKKVQSLINQIVQEYCQENELVRSTGMIPTGIQGSLPQLVQIPLQSDFSDIPEVKVAALSGTFSPIFSESNLQRIKKKYGVSLQIHFFTSPQISTIHAVNPDVVTGSWAGGFNDPSGFLALLNRYLGQDFKKYLGSLGPQLVKAEAEQKSTERASNFRDLGTSVVTESLMVPGWRVATFEVKSTDLQAKSFQARYTPRLVNYVQVKQK